MNVANTFNDLCAALIVGGLMFSVMLLMEPCRVLSEILADWLSEKFSRNK